MSWKAVDKSRDGATPGHGVYVMPNDGAHKASESCGCYPHVIYETNLDGERVPIYIHHEGH